MTTNDGSHPGLEFAGMVTERGPGVHGIPVGARVMGLLAGGGYAEYVVVPATHVLEVPEGWSWEEAASGVVSNKPGSE